MALPASILGINIPSLPFGAPYCALSDGGSVPSISYLALVSPAGTFRAAIAALVSVYMIVIDEVQVGIASPILQDHEHLQSTLARRREPRDSLQCLRAIVYLSRP